MAYGSGAARSSQGPHYPPGRLSGQQYSEIKANTGTLEWLGRGNMDSNIEPEDGNQSAYDQHDDQNYYQQFT